MSRPKGIESPLELARRLSLPFLDNPYLLTRALTHTSYLNEHNDVLDDNERLEFLGDAVLDFVVGAWLYEHCPEMREGELTKARSALVRTEQLAAFARQVDLGRAMRENQTQLRALGVSTPEIDTMIEIARLAGSPGAKLTGAGGGGCVIALAGEHGRAIERAWSRAGFHTWLF